MLLEHSHHLNSSPITQFSFSFHGIFELSLCFTLYFSIRRLLCCFDILGSDDVWSLDKL